MHDETELSSDNDNEIQHNNAMLSNNNLQSNNITEINLEGSIIDITSFFSQQTIASPFVGQVFETWQEVDEYLQEYSWQEKFVVIKIRNERGPPPDQTYRRRTYACNHQGAYEPKKSVILENQRNSKSKRTECPWHMNVTFPKKATTISITSLNISHNHPLNPQTNSHASKNRTLPEAIEREICFYTVEGNLNATIQRRFLSAKFPNVTIYPRNLQNLIQKYKIANWEDNNASKLLRHLLNKKTEEPG
ncbi:hypothetical protein C2G38_2225685 [Gigaspora rosea]|uniref:FAR1 domain-containing protein n=1 Tax=Gigaspora rosea TaxID=44941 RepID=A0A397U801_9GLOM|nr:hypothetical protein C2G38_2225685 [Gigaspora rosea]